MNEQMENQLRDAGASVVGFTDGTEILGDEILHLVQKLFIGIARNLNDHIIHFLCSLQKQIIGYVRAQQYQSLRISPDFGRPFRMVIFRRYLHGTSLELLPVHEYDGPGKTGRSTLTRDEE